MLDGLIQVTKSNDEPWVGTGIESTHIYPRCLKESKFHSSYKKLFDQCRVS